MGFRVISKEALERMVRSLQQQQYRVVGPKPVAGEYIFAEIESPDDLHLDYTQTVVPPKQYLLPQGLTETPAVKHVCFKCRREVACDESGEPFDWYEPDSRQGEIRPA